MSLNCLYIMNILDKIRTKYNSLTHSKETGERVEHLNNVIDDITKINTTRKLTYRQLVKLRSLTVAKTTVQVGTGIATGILLGKSIFTGTLLSIGAYVVVDIFTYSPMQSLTERVLTSKTKKA